MVQKIAYKQLMLKYILIKISLRSKLSIKEIQSQNWKGF